MHKNIWYRPAGSKLYMSMLVHNYPSERGSRVCIDTFKVLFGLGMVGSVYSAANLIIVRCLFYLVTIQHLIWDLPGQAFGISLCMRVWRRRNVEGTSLLHTTFLNFDYAILAT